MTKWSIISATSKPCKVYVSHQRGFFHQYDGLAQPFTSAACVAHRGLGFWRQRSVPDIGLLDFFPAARAEHMFSGNWIFPLVVARNV